MIDLVRKNTVLPTIFCGGAGSSKDFVNILKTKNVSLAAANIFHFKELSYQNIKKILQNKIKIREPIFKSYYVKRTPSMLKMKHLKKLKLISEKLKQVMMVI